MPAETGTDCDEDRVEISGTLSRQNVLDIVVDDDLDAHGLDALDLPN